MPSLSAWSRVILSGALVTALVQALPDRAEAETRVEGSADLVTVEARNASIQEVLAALGASYGVQVRGETGLNAVVDGTYKGTLRGVIRRLLAGSSFVTKISAGNLDVTILDSPSSVPLTGMKRAPVRALVSSPNSAAPRGRTSISNRRDGGANPPAAIPQFNPNVRVGTPANR